jgi:hypothetical protein
MILKHIVKEIGMVGYLPQLHHGVLETLVLDLSVDIGLDETLIYDVLVNDLLPGG